ncbi:MAG: hypothetical protein K6A63_02820 [Acholeplasmatales bacterium]|nr:hypothetical protein [Acholeplasmatales bacterium]
MPKKKKDKSKIDDLIKELDYEMENENLTDKQKEAYKELKEILEKGNYKPKATFKTVMLLFSIIMMILMIAYIMSISLFGFLASFIVVKNWYSLLWVSAILAGLYLITGGIDLKRMGYDKIYLESRIVISVFKIALIMLLNNLVFKVFDISAIWIFYMITFELLATYVVKKFVL